VRQLVLEELRDTQQGADGTICECWYYSSWSGPAAPFVPRATSAGSPVQVVQTTANLSERLTQTSNLQFGGSSPSGVPVITVNDGDRYQRVSGVGAAMTDTSAWLIYSQLDPATRTALMNDLFGANGIHLGFMLVPMAASDFTKDGRPYTYDDMPAGQSDPRSWRSIRSPTTSRTSSRRCGRCSRSTRRGV
jgi:Glycosyl hydrolase family 30 TIM-barrel domain